MVVYGKNGYLLSWVLKTTEIKSSTCLFFCTPIDVLSSEDYKRYKQSQRLLLQAISECKSKGLKMIYASSMGVYEDTQYSKFKLQDESLVQGLREYLIYRIPRVYSSDRDKGLISLLRHDLVPYKDYNNYVDYITIEEFLQWFQDNLSKTGIVEYHGPVHYETIKQIKDRFINNEN